MGINGLNKNLIEAGSVINKNNNQKTFNHVLCLFCDEKKYIKKFIFHIDLSLMLYKFLYISDNMETAYNLIKKNLLSLKKNNNKILFYLDPERNVRKAETQGERRYMLKQTQEKLKKKIIKDLDLFKEFKSSGSNLKINDILLEVIDFNNDEELNITFEEYKEKIEIFKNNNNIYIFDDSIKKELCRHSIFDNELSFPDDEDDDVLEDVEPYNNKLLFQYFLNKNKMKHHHRYLIERLIEENIISNDMIIKSERFDGEINIIYNIKKKYINKKNLITSIDQDCVLFALLHIETKYIYIKGGIGGNGEDLTIIKNNYISKNVAILTAFLNKTDYFKGIKDCGLTPLRLRSFIDAYEFIIDNEIDIEELIATYIYWFVTYKKNKIKNEEIIFDNIKNYFENFKLYLSLEYSFYEKNIKFPKINVDILHQYFILNKQPIPFLDETSNKKIYKNYNELF